MQKHTRANPLNFDFSDGCRGLDWKMCNDEGSKLEEKPMSGTKNKNLQAHSMKRAHREKNWTW